jgi:hypothetical protein
MFTPISGAMQHLDLSDAALIKGLADVTGNDRYPFSPRIQTLRGDRGQTQTRAGLRARAAAQGLRPAASDRSEKATARVVSSSGPPSA